MSDEHNHEHHMHGMIFQMPPEIAEAMERSEMEGTSFRHDLNRLFDEMSEADLKTLKAMFETLNHMPPKFAARQTLWTEAIIAGKLEKRFDICLGCGANHSTIPAEMLDEQNVRDDEDEKAEPAQNPIEMKETDELLEEYNLQRLAAVDGGTGTQLVCKGCGMTYGSLADRMRRDPGIEGCGGCVHKQKWG